MSLYNMNTQETQSAFSEARRSTINTNFFSGLATKTELINGSYCEEETCLYEKLNEVVNHLTICLSNDDIPNDFLVMIQTKNFRIIVKVGDEEEEEQVPIAEATAVPPTPPNEDDAVTQAEIVGVVAEVIASIITT